MNHSSDPKKFANSRPSASKFFSITKTIFSYRRSEHFGNKIPWFSGCDFGKRYAKPTLVCVFYVKTEKTEEIWKILNLESLCKSLTLN